MKKLEINRNARRNAVRKVHLECEMICGLIISGTSGAVISVSGVVCYFRCPGCGALLIIGCGLISSKNLEEIPDARGGKVTNEM